MLKLIITTIIILILTVKLCTSLDLLCPCEYLNQEKLEKLHNKNNEIQIRCYHNGAWYVCPNPQDKNRRDGLKQQYEAGKYIFFDDYYISSDQFTDCGICNTFLDRDKCKVNMENW